jgi:hypothetical protein
MDCTAVTPVSAFLSTNLTSKITSFGRLGQRISRALGAPLINIEIHQDQLFENIGIACEMFTKFAGYTEELLIFDSDLYEDGIGLRLDELFSITPYFNRTNKTSPIVYVTNTALTSSFFTNSETLSSTYADGLYVNQILNKEDYNNIVTFNTTYSSYFTPSNANQTQYVNSFDYDIMDYRKVIDVIDFEEGSNNGVNTLFTIEQTLAQQTYFSYAMGNYGFDLISWVVLKNWLDTREKVLAQKRYLQFDDRTQMMTMFPPPRTPGSGHRFYGIVACYVERPLRDIIKEPWVYQYALALTKISIGQIRGKYANMNLLGGGTLNFNDILSQGLNEKKELEDKLYTGAPGLGDVAPPQFFVG